MSCVLVILEMRFSLIPSMFGITRMKFLFIIVPITLLLIYIFVTFVKVLLDSHEDLYDTQADRDRYKKTLAPMVGTVGMNKCH